MRKKAGIPDHIRHRSKPQMALDMILDLLEKGVQFDNLNFDALSGSSKSTVATLVEKGIHYVGAVKQNMHVFLKKPDFVSPETAVKTRGRKRKYPQTKNEAVKVSDYRDTFKEEQWRKIAFRNGPNKLIEALFHSREVWVCTDEKTENLCRLILLIKMIQTVRLNISSPTWSIWISKNSLTGRYSGFSSKK